MPESKKSRRRPVRVVKKKRRTSRTYRMYALNGRELILFDAGDFLRKAKKRS